MSQEGYDSGADSSVDGGAVEDAEAAPAVEEEPTEEDVEGAEAMAEDLATSISEALGRFMRVAASEPGLLANGPLLPQILQFATASPVLGDETAQAERAQAQADARHLLEMLTASGFSTALQVQLPLEQRIANSSVAREGVMKACSEVVQCSGEEDICAVCQCEIGSGLTGSKLQCGHIYHPECINSWLLRGKLQCPICKTPLSKSLSVRCHPHPLEPADPLVVHHGHAGKWFCDGCRAMQNGRALLNPEGNMWHCAEGCDYDLCDACLESEVGPAN